MAQYKHAASIIHLVPVVLHEIGRVITIYYLSRLPIWQDLTAVDNPELSALAEFLPVVVLRGRAPSTVRKYSGAFLRWKKWAKAKHVGIQILPAKPLHVALYLAFLIQKSSTSAPVGRPLILCHGPISWLAWRIPLSADL